MTRIRLCCFGLALFRRICTTLSTLAMISCAPSYAQNPAPQDAAQVAPEYGSIVGGCIDMNRQSVNVACLIGRVSPIIPHP